MIYMSIPKYTERLPYHLRFGPQPLRSTPQPIEKYEMPLPIPAVLFEPEDWTLTRTDRLRMHTYSRDDDPVKMYHDNPEVQRVMIANEYAALRIRRDKPHLYAALEASERISSIVRKTPLISGDRLVHAPHARVLLKMENKQYERSFKLRGAANAILQLTHAQHEQGVVTVSAGNHGLGVARAAAETGITATVFMSLMASPVKVSRIKELGARVEQVGSTFDEASLACMEMLADKPGPTFIHPYDNQAVTVGQSSVLIEYLDEMSKLDGAFLPVGGGGFIGWNAAAIKEYNKDALIVGVQAEGSDAARKSKQADQIVTIDEANRISDGTAVRSPGKIPFELMRTSVDDFVTVTDHEIASVVVDYHQMYNDRIEAAGALAVAAMRKMAGQLRGTVVGMVSGGNISDEALLHMYDLVGQTYHSEA
jgi:threonine dehydratase